MRTAAPASEAAAEPKKSTAKRATKKTSNSTKGAAKKNSSRQSSRKTATRSVPRAKKAPEPSDEDIRLRAYFIAERRVQLSLEGDPANDWIQARQELLAEFGHTNGS
jgi:hypothetical protein